MKKTAIFGLVFVLVQLARPAVAETLNIGIPPQQSPTEVVKRWAPVLQYKGLEKSSDADYNDVRKLNLPLQVQ